MVIGGFPMFKLTGLALMQISRPVGGMIRRYAENHPIFRKHVILRSAQMYNRMEVRLKMWTIGLHQPKVIPELKEAAAMELATHILEELIVFVLAATAVIYEIRRATKNAKLRKTTIKTDRAEIVIQIEKFRQILNDQDSLIKEMDRVVRLIELRAHAKLKHRLLNLIDAEKEDKTLIELKSAGEETKMKQNLKCDEEENIDKIDHLSETTKFPTLNESINAQNTNKKQMEQNEQLMPAKAENFDKIVNVTDDVTCETTETSSVVQNLLKDATKINEQLKQSEESAKMESIEKNMNRQKNDFNNELADTTKFIVIEKTKDINEAKNDIEKNNINEEKDVNAANDAANDISAAQHIGESKDISAANDISEATVVKTGMDNSKTKDISEANVVNDANDAALILNAANDISEAQDISVATVVNAGKDNNEAKDVKDVNKLKNVMCHQNIENENKSEIQTNLLTENPLDVNANDVNIEEFTYEEVTWVE